MFEFVLVPLVVVVVAVIAWLMLSGRSERDPSSSVDAFHRALTAMQPEDEADETPDGTAEAAAAEEAEQPDETGDRQGPGTA